MTAKDKKFVFLLLIISIITFFRWLTFSVFSYGDWWYFYSESMRSLFNLSSWSSVSGLGFLDLTLWRYPVINFPFGVFGYLGYGQEVAEKFTIFWPTLIMGNIIVFAFVKRFVKSSFAGFVGAIVFNYNTYYLGTTHILIYSAGVWSILSLILFMELLQTQKFYKGVLLSLSLAITSSYDLRVVYMLFFIFFLYFIYHILVLETVKNFTQLKIQVQKVIYPILLFTSLSLYWIFPLIAANALTNNSILNRLLFGSDFLKLSYSFALYYPFWNGTKTIPFIIQKIPFYYWFIPICAILGLIINKRNKSILFFGYLILIGILLSKQIAAPFVNLYIFLFTRLPGFSAFREATKFYFFIIIGYSVLIGSFTFWVEKKFTSLKRFQFIAYGVLYGLVLIFLLTCIPIMSGDIGSMYISRSIPNDNLIVRSFIQNQKSYFRTLWVPILPRYGISTIVHPALSGIEMNINWEIKDLDQLLDNTAIKYVIVPIHDLDNDDDFFKDYGKRELFIQTLANLKLLKKINIGTKELLIYENRGFKPHIYSTEKKETIYKDVFHEKVNYEFKNPAEYKTALKNISHPIYLNFSEAFHPDWKLRVGEFNWFKVLIDKNYFLSDRYHTESDAKLNSFYIDPKVICKSYECKINSDGTHDIFLTLYFRPQGYMHFGLIISGITLFMCLTYLVYVGVKGIRKHNE